MSSSILLSILDRQFKVHYVDMDLDWAENKTLEKNHPTKPIIYIPVD